MGVFNISENDKILLFCRFFISKKSVSGKMFTKSGFFTILYVTKSGFYCTNNIYKFHSQLFKVGQLYCV